MSRYGWISFSLISRQMMRVISSPSSSTTGFFTLILAILRALVEGARTLDRANVERWRSSPPSGGGRLVAKDWRGRKQQCFLTRGKASGRAGREGAFHARRRNRPHARMDRRRTGRRAGRAAAWREHRGGGARHGELRP